MTSIPRPQSALLAAAALVLSLAPAFAAGEQTPFEVSLSGPEASGDPDGRGEATVTVDAETNRISVELRYSNIAEPTSMHIREGAVGLDGDVVVPFVTELEEDGTFVGHRDTDPDVIEAILASPEEYYLNVLNEEYPVGALRGPLGK